MKLRGDADETYFGEVFVATLLKHRMQGTFAAPRHQEQNGICERAWQSIRNIAFKTMAHAHVGDEFYDFAIEHAWKVFNMLPIRDLLDDEGNPTAPISTYKHKKPMLSRLKAMFCPCVINNGANKRPKDPDHPKRPRAVNTRANCGERGIKAIHVGLPRYQNGWLCYLPSTGGLRVSKDVSFDENFYSTTAQVDLHSRFSRFSGGIRNLPMSLPLIPLENELERTGNAWPFTSAVEGLEEECDSDNDTQRFANPTVDELFDQTKELNDDEPDNHTNHLHDDSGDDSDNESIPPMQELFDTNTRPFVNNPDHGDTNDDPDNDSSSSSNSSTSEEENDPSTDANGRSKRTRITGADPSTSTRAQHPVLDSPNMQPTKLASSIAPLAITPTVHTCALPTTLKSTLTP